MSGRVVRDRDGTRYILEKRSSESSRVRNPETGERRHLPNDDLEPISDESPLDVAVDSLPDAAVALVTGVPNEQALGILVELDARGPTAVRTLLDTTALCESDLHGSVALLQLSGLIEETTVGGERGYRVTETARSGLSLLR